MTSTHSKGRAAADSNPWQRGTTLRQEVEAVQAAAA